MKITVNIDPKHPDAAIGLKWTMPGETVDARGYERSSLYLLPAELEPKAYPHAVKDLSRVAVFYHDHFVLFHAPDQDYCRDFIARTRCENVYCDTQKLLEVIRKLHASRALRPPLWAYEKAPQINRRIGSPNSDRVH